MLDRVREDDSYPTIFQKFGIGRSTVGDVKKNRDKILKFVSLTERGSGA